MPFLEYIAKHINDTLKEGALKQEKLQPAKFFELTTTVVRKKEPNRIELLPAIITPEGKATPITADSKVAIQLYHKLLTNTYSYEKKGYGDGYVIKSVSEIAMVVFTNSKLTGVSKDKLEPVVLFGMPQQLLPVQKAELGIDSCLITPVSSNMDHVQVFRQEYPNSDYFLNEQVSMFLIRYRVEMKFDRKCVDTCICNN